MSTRALGAVGIDIGTRHVRIARVDPRTSRVTAYAVFSRLRPGEDVDDAEAARIRAVMLRRGIEQTRVVVSVPQGVSSAAVLELPPRSSGAPVDQLARVEMARLHRCGPDALEAVCWDVPLGFRGGATATVMAVSCPTEKAMALVGSLEQAGLIVEGIDLECCALARAARVWGGDPQACLILDLGAITGRVSIVSKGVVLMERRLGELGMAERVENLAKYLGIPDDGGARLLERGPDALTDWHSAREATADVVAEIAAEASVAVSESLKYVQGRAPDVRPDAVLLAGWGARIAGLDAATEKRSGLQTRTLTPDADGAACDGSAAVAGGLACWLIEEGAP